MYVYLVHVTAFKVEGLKNLRIGQNTEYRTGKERDQPFRNDGNGMHLKFSKYFTEIGYKVPRLRISPLDVVDGDKSLYSVHNVFD